MGSEMTCRTARGFVNRPGHWTMAPNYPYLCIHCGTDFDAHKSTWPEMLCPANRRALNEAAPDMLDALEDALTMLYADEGEVADYDAAIRKVENAIKKAKGL